MVYGNWGTGIVWQRSSKQSVGKGQLTGLNRRRPRSLSWGDNCSVVEVWGRLRVGLGVGGWKLEV